MICLVDAVNLERHFYLATQVMELGLPVIVVINKTDEAEERGITIAAKRLEERLGVGRAHAGQRTRGYGGIAGGAQRE